MPNESGPNVSIAVSGAKEMGDAFARMGERLARAFSNLGTTTQAFNDSMLSLRSALGSVPGGIVIPDGSVIIPDDDEPWDDFEGLTEAEARELIEAEASEMSRERIQADLDQRIMAGRPTPPAEKRDSLPDVRRAIALGEIPLDEE